jgi:hypothetical protein
MLRWYDEEVGRFISEDPYTGDPNDPRTLNLYTYGANNPLIYIDPSGHSFKDFKDLVGKIASFLDSGSAIINWVSGKGFKTNSQLNTEQRDKIAKNAGGTDMATAQASLAMLGYDLGKYGVDGKQGNYTTKAIADFQKAAGLTPTGKLDAQTTAALNMVVGAGLNKGQIEIIGQSMGHYDTGIGTKDNCPSMMATIFSVSSVVLPSIIINWK